MDPASVNVLRAYQQNLMVMASYAMEARLCQRAFEQCRQFVKSFEMAHYDGGLVTSAYVVDKEGGPARTLFTLLDDHPENPKDAGYQEGLEDSKMYNVVVVDMKHLEAICDSKRGCTWKFAISSKQRENCYAFIIASTKEPNYVVILPAFCLPPAKPRHKNEKDDVIRDEEIKEEITNEAINITTFRPMWMLHQVPPFPGEYTLFIQPITQLGKALDDMMAFIEGSSTVWKNEYTGAILASKDLPYAKLQKPSALLPSRKGHIHAMDQVKGLYKAFAQYSDEFRVELVGVSPLLADLKLIGKSQKEELFVEVKKDFCFLEERGPSPQLCIQQENHDFQRLTFGWKSQWDYLFSTVKNRPSLAYLLPRDQIPITWFNSRPEGNFPLKLGSNAQKYRVDMSSEQKQVEDIENILRKEDKERSIKAQRRIPVEVSEREYLGKRSIVRKKADSESDLWFQRWSTHGFLRGFGSAKHFDFRGDTYEQFASEVLIEICYISKKGVVCDFGVWNPVCRYAIARYSHGPEDVTYYERHREPSKRVWDLHKDTRVVPLDFTHMTWTGHDAPSSTSHSEARAKDARLRAKFPRLMVLDMYSIKCMRMHHGRFIVPSSNLCTLTHNHRGLLKKDKGVTDEYYVEFNNLIDTLTAPLGGNGQFTVGSCQEVFEAADYSLTVGEIHQAGVDGIGKRKEHKGNAYKE